MVLCFASPMCMAIILLTLLSIIYIIYMLVSIYLYLSMEGYIRSVFISGVVLSIVCYILAGVSVYCTIYCENKEINKNKTICQIFEEHKNEC